MRFVVGSDDEGAALDAAVEQLRQAGHDVEVLERDQWPDVAARVAAAVASGNADQGVLFCWTGTGTAMAANKVAGVRCAVCHDVATVLNSREHNDANVLALGAGVVPAALARRMVSLWLATAHGGGRHLRRVMKIRELDG